MEENPSATGLFAIFVTTSTGGEQMYYTFKDHQGSLAAAVHGNTVERLVYDPATASFLSPDRYMQDPTSAQGFNRYAYCMNNPLRFIDPTGYYVTYGGGHKPDGPLQQVVMDGHVGFVLPEVTVTAYENPINHFEFTYEPNNSGGGSGGYLSYGLNSNNPTIGSSGGGGGGNGAGHSGVVTTPTKNTNININIEIASKALSITNLYTTIEGTLHYNTITRTWMDKKGIIRNFDFYGNQYTGGIISYGKTTSTKFTNSGRVLGLAGVALSCFQFENSKTMDERIEYCFDALIGLAGVIAPEVFGILSTAWFFGGKQVVFGMGIQR